ncbi:MAG: hypothetical protein HY543_00260 [Deltaproteobacteria bacterium]|nr:hypothetical protein [Deltaproteobacteria bacterium]
MKKLIPELIGIGQLQRETTQTVRKIAQKNEEAFIVSHNKPQAVLISLSRYQTLKTLEEAKAREEAEVAAIIAQGDEEFTTGKTIRKHSLKDLT